jgi:hypothetical protein
MALVTDHREDTLDVRTTEVRTNGDIQETRSPRLPPRYGVPMWSHVRNLPMMQRRLHP